MSAVQVATCLCETIGKPASIHFCDEHHRYSYGDRKLASFSHVLRTVYPQKAAELEKIDPGVLEHARERGGRVDQYASEYARTGNVTLPAGEWEEVKERVGIFVDWFEAEKPIVRGVQQIVYDLEDGIAATKDFDFVAQGAPAIVDLKCTASPDWTWKLQLGCHARYSKNGSDLYILHINPKLYKRGGVKLIPYNSVECLRIYDAARMWWRELQGIR